MTKGLEAGEDTAESRNYKELSLSRTKTLIFPVAAGEAEEAIWGPGDVWNRLDTVQRGAKHLARDLHWSNTWKTIGACILALSLLPFLW